MNSIEVIRDYRTLGKPVSELECGVRLDMHLGKHFLFHSRSSWQKKLKAKQVLVNGRPAKSTYKLKEGDQIRYWHPGASEPEVDRDLKSLWQKDGIMAVYKPSNLPMHEGGRYRFNTFSEIMKEVIGPEWAAVHRLDRDTSGIVLCANSTDLRNSLAKELRDRTLSKTYLAIARGDTPSRDSWVEEGSIGFTDETTFREKRWVTTDGLPSRTGFKVLDSKDSGQYHLMEATPKTGRTHQIRIHSAFNDLPLVGESKYHPDEKVFLDYIENGFTDFVMEKIEYSRLCLHATEVKFRHPTDDKVYTISCPMPEDMAAIWDQLT